MNRAPRFLWAIAAASSLATHAAVGMVLYAMPMPEEAPAKQTEITIETAEDGTATRLASTIEVSAIAPEATVAATDPSRTLAPSAAIAEIVQPVSAQPVASAPSVAPTPLVPVDGGETLAAPAAPADPVEPMAVQPQIAASAVAPTLDPVQEPASAPSPVQETANADLPAPAPVAALSESVAVAPFAAGLLAEQRSDSDSVAAAAANGVDVQPAQSGIVAAAPIAAPAPLAPSQPAAPMMAAVPTVEAAPVATPSAPIMAAPALIVPPGPTVLSPSGGPTAPEAVGTEVTMLPRPDAITSDATPLAPQAGTPGRKSSRQRIAEFLAEQKDAAECVVAVPTGVGLQQASISAFADAPEKVARLGDEYERRSGVDLRAHTQAVSQPQCGALAFARDLAQYPNFPLSLTLSPPQIGSGQELAGVISGLRKDTLYLMVVDDEGKAELVQSYTGLRVNVMPFHAPMTLTSGPVSTVQLLVAIASKGPLLSVPNRPGLPADDYFENLKREIISDQRSIDYGIAGFVVR